MTSVFILFLALVIDALMGEPKWLWSRLSHPVVIIGRLISAFDAALNRPPFQKAKGVLTLGCLILSGAVAGFLAHALPNFIQALIVAILIAQKSLSDHVGAVASALEQDLNEARQQVGNIVGRESAEMKPDDIARAAIESSAENLADGVIAPAFWFLIGGLPGLFIYKITNTADSMIGHTTARHLDFGWAAARFDDLLNWIPARLSALLLVIAFGFNPRWGEITIEAKKHRSLNAGWPEAAMAFGLGIALSGPRRYHGRLSSDPFINSRGRKNADSNDIRCAQRALWKAWGWLLVSLAPIALVFALKNMYPAW